MTENTENDDKIENPEEKAASSAAADEEERAARLRAGIKEAFQRDIEEALAVDPLPPDGKPFGLTPTQRRVADAVIDRGLSWSEAYYQESKANRRSSSIEAKRTMHHPLVRAYVRRRLLQAGALESALNVYLAGMEATQSMVSKDSGELILTDIPDHHERREAANRVVELLDAKPRAPHRRPNRIDRQLNIGTVHIDREAVTLAANEPLPVLQWILENEGKLPSPAVRRQLLSEGKILDTEEKKN